MIKLKYIAIIVLLAVSSTFLRAQVNEVSMRVRAGHNVALGSFTAVSLETHQLLNDNFKIQGGIQYNTIGKTTLEARPAYFKDYSWGKLSTEVLLTYANITSVNSFAAGAGVVLSGRWIEGKLGYYYRMFGGKGSSINEPFNIYYEFCANLLPMIEDWNLKMVITNNEIFELERHYQPTFIAQCSYYPLQYLGISLGIGCKPSGMFNMSADYYQSHVNLGICYRW